MYIAIEFVRQVIIETVNINICQREVRFVNKKKCSYV